MNGFEKKILYRFVRRIQLELKEGIYLEDPETKKLMGHIFDRDIQKLKKGQPLDRTVDELDEDHGFDMRIIRPPGEHIYERLFKVERVGSMRDNALNEFPFDQGDNIRIKMKYLAPELVEITIRTI